MFKFFSRTRDRSSGHLKDKLGQDLFLFNKVSFGGFLPSLWIDYDNSRDMCFYKYPKFLAGCGTWLSTKTFGNRSRSWTELVGYWNKQWAAKNVSFVAKLYSLTCGAIALRKPDSVLGFVSEPSMTPRRNVRFRKARNCKNLLISVVCGPRKPILHPSIRSHKKLWFYNWTCKGLVRIHLSNAALLSCSNFNFDRSVACDIVFSLQLAKTNVSWFLSYNEIYHQDIANLHNPPFLRIFSSSLSLFCTHYTWFQDEITLEIFIPSFRMW